MNFTEFALNIFLFVQLPPILNAECATKLDI